MEAGSRTRTWLGVAALLLVAAALVLLFLPYRASSDPGLFRDPDAGFEGITIECGNFFGGISGGPANPEVVEAGETAEPLSRPQILDEYIEAADACTTGGVLRVSIAGALLILALLLILRSRRTVARAEETD